MKENRKNRIETFKSFNIKYLFIEFEYVTWGFEDRSLEYFQDTELIF